MDSITRSNVFTVIELMKKVIQEEDNREILQANSIPMDYLLHYITTVFQDEMPEAAREPLKVWLQLLHNCLTQAKMILHRSNSSQWCVDCLGCNPGRLSKEIKNWKVHFDYLFRCLVSDISVFVRGREAVIAPVITPIMPVMKDVTEEEEKRRILQTEFRPLDDLLQHISAVFQDQQKSAAEPLKIWLQLLHNSLTQANTILHGYGPSQRQRRHLDCLIGNRGRSPQPVKEWKSTGICKSVHKQFICRFRRLKQQQRMESKLEFPQSAILTPYNYFEWKPKIQLHLRSRGLFRITMETEVEPTSAVEKSRYFNRMDEAFGILCLSISPELLFYVESCSTPNEVWKILEELFGKQNEMLRMVEDSIATYRNSRENFSLEPEDPHVASLYATNYVQGLQETNDGDPNQSEGIIRGTGCANVACTGNEPKKDNVAAMAASLATGSGQAQATNPALTSMGSLNSPLQTLNPPLNPGLSSALNPALSNSLLGATPPLHHSGPFPAFYDQHPQPLPQHSQPLYSQSRSDYEPVTRSFKGLSGPLPSDVVAELYNVGTPMTEQYMVLDTAVCSQLNAYDCQGGDCVYETSYGDGSHSAGSFAIETLTFGTTSVHNVAIGCGHDNVGLFVRTAGLLGLGAGTLSFTTELGTQTGRRFSYCMIDRASESSGTLEFGPESVPVEIDSG